MVSIKDVAKLAGVSVMTVSRTINKNYPVSAKTRKLVMDAVEKLGYEPNVMGRNLRKTENKTVLVAGLGFVDAMLMGIYKAANELGYEVILMHTRVSDKQDYIRRIKNGMTSGILFMNMFDEQTLTEIASNFHMVQCGYYIDIPNSCSVSINSENAVYELTDMLAKQGRRRIAYISNSVAGFIPNGIDVRKRGYLRALADNGLEAHPDLLLQCEFLREDYTPAASIAENFASLKSELRPDAVISEQDCIAIACVNTFKDRGIKVPEDIAVASFDDNPVNTIIKPSITAIRQPYEAMGREAMELLAAKIEGSLNDNKQVIFRHEIVVRESTNKCCTEICI